MASSIYLVVEPINIIATDLAQSVQDFDSEAIVLVASVPNDAITMVADHPVIRVALIHANPHGFAESGLGIALAARGAQCVFMGDAAERAVKAMRVLQRPFSTSTIAALLEELSGVTSN
jgi:hypothetical protein